MEKQTSTNTSELRRGVTIFVILAVLTVIEYLIGTLLQAPVLLWVTAILKAGLVIWFFMHLSRVFNPGEGGHE